MPAHEDRELLIVGRIVRGHGVRGEIKVLPESDNPERLVDLECVFVGASVSEAIPFSINTARFQQTKKGLAVLIVFEGVNSREAADSLKNLLVFADREDLPPLEEGEYYLHDLVGSTVVTVSGELVGTLKDILELPAHNIYVIKRTGMEDAMVPAVPTFIEKVDVEAQHIVIRPIEGLLDG